MGAVAVAKVAKSIATPIAKKLGIPTNIPLGGLIGTAGGAMGTGFKNPAMASIQQGTNAGQVMDATGNVGNNAASQQALLAALQNQGATNLQTNATNQQQALAAQLAANNGIANQGAVYNQGQNLANNIAAQGGIGAQGNALSQQAAFNNALSGGVGYQNSAVSGLQGIAGQQQATGAQLQQIANGQGPNPAQAALNQATGENVANQAALMAGQRGASANVGLIARQAGQQGGATQQQAAGQAATLQAQQELGALSGLTAQQQAQAATQAQIGNLGTTQAGMQQSGIGQQANIGATLTNQQQQQQQLLAQQAQAQVANQQQAQNAMLNQSNLMTNQQMGQTNTNAAAAQNEQNILMGGLSNLNTANVSSQNNVNLANAGLASTTMQGQQGMVGGLLNAAGVAMGAEGGEVEKKPQKMAEGGTPNIVATPQPGAQSSFGQFLQNAFQSNVQQDQVSPDQSFNMGQTPGANSLQKGAASAGAGLMKALSAAKGGMAEKGGNVKASSPNQKAVKAGNSYSNDKIPAKLSEGEIVIPRSITMGSDPVRGAADFVAKALAKRRKAA